MSHRSPVLSRMLRADKVCSSAKQDRINSFLKLISPFGILESARTGLTALPRSPIHGAQDESVHKEADEVVDASQLPPG